MTHIETNSPFLLLAPASCGWQAMCMTHQAEWSHEEADSFSGAVTAGYALAAELRFRKDRAKRLPVEVALPVRCGVFERLTLPSVDRGELLAMTRLQFEKSLPYPIEATSLGFQVLSQAGTETTLLACAVHEPVVASLCAPLIERGIPRRLAFWAMHIAAQAQSGSVACGFWREEDRVIFGIFENRKLSFLETLAGEIDLRSALPGILMRAEMAGAATGFSEILLDPALAALGETLVAYFKAPARHILPQGGKVEDVDLTPGQWRSEQARCERRVRVRRWVALTGSLYAAGVAACLVYLNFQSQRLESLRKQAASLQPQVDAVIARQARWKALAPAVDPHRFAVELLFQTWQSLPSPDVRITRFELLGRQFVVEGEAPNAQQAILFVEKLKEEPELAGYRFESKPPVLLPNDHAQFQIFGKQ